MKNHRAIYPVLVPILQVFLLLNCRNEVSKSHPAPLTSFMTNMIAFLLLYNGDLEFNAKRRIIYSISATVNIKTQQL